MSRSERRGRRRTAHTLPRVCAHAELHLARSVQWTSSHRGSACPLSDAQCRGSRDPAPTNPARTETPIQSVDAARITRKNTARTCTQSCTWPAWPDRQDRFASHPGTACPALVQILAQVTRSRRSPLLSMQHTFMGVPKRPGVEGWWPAGWPKQPVQRKGFEDTLEARLHAAS